MMRKELGQSLDVFCDNCCAADDIDVRAEARKVLRSQVPGFDVPLEQALGALAQHDAMLLAGPRAHSEVTMQNGAKVKAFTTQCSFEAWLLAPVGGQELGMDVDPSDGVTLLVTNVSDGVVRDYNGKHPSKEIACGDRITRVNGVTGSAQDMLLRIRADSRLLLTIRTLPERVIQIVERDGGETMCGIERLQEDTMSLLVTEVPKGLRMVPESLMKHDRVVAVNDVRFDPARMDLEIRQASLPIIMAIRRIDT